jgi:drug/metabolite transporter (DMT)-like permease
MQPKPNTMHAIAFAVSAMVCFAAMSTTVRWASEHIETTQLVFLRNVLSFALIVSWIQLRYGRSVYQTNKLSGHLWRAGLGVMAMELWFYSLSILPINTATALSFTTPVFATLFAMWILKEKAGWRRWSAILISFIGVLIILRPDVQGISWQAGTVLVSSSLMALAGIVVKTLTRTEPPETIVFYMALFMTPLSAPLALYHWSWQPLSQPAVWAAIGLIAFFSTAAHLLIARAYARAEMVALLPFDFTRLLFTALFAYMLFGEVMDGHTLLGAAIIITSAVYIAHREAVRRKQKPVA